MGNTKWVDRVTLGVSALLLGISAIIVVLLLSSCSVPPAPQSPLPTPAAKIAVGAVTDELTVQATKMYTWPFNIQWSGGNVGPLALSSEGPITTTLWVDIRLKRGDAVVYSSSVKSPLSAPDAPGEGQFDRVVASYSIPSGQYQLYNRVRWELAATSTIFNDSTGQVITSPVFGYFQDDSGVIASRDSEGFSYVGIVTKPYVYYCPIITKNAR